MEYKENVESDGEYDAVSFFKSLWEFSWMGWFLVPSLKTYPDLFETWKATTCEVDFPKFAAESPDEVRILQLSKNLSI